MPKSKRNKLVTLSKTEKKGREHKETIVSAVRKSFDDFKDLYVFEFENMRNAKLKEFRDELKDTSRFFLGSNKVLQVSLGREESEAFRDNTDKISAREPVHPVLREPEGDGACDIFQPEGRYRCLVGVFGAPQLLQGNRGLLFTNLPKDDVIRRFEEFEESDFARTGSTATQTVELKEGPLEQFTHDMEPYLRKQGMPVRLNKGVVELVADHTVCVENEPISPEASRLLLQKRYKELD